MNPILSALTSAVLTITGGTIHCGDCFDFLPLIPDGSVDMVLMDPPYGTTACKWDTCLDLTRLWAELDRVTKKNAAIVMFGSQPFTTTLIASNIKRFRYEWVWDKVNKYSGILNANKMPLKRHENIVVFYRSLPTYNRQWGEGKPYINCRTGARNIGLQLNGGKELPRLFTNNDGRRNPHSILSFPNDHKKGRHGHPTEKPVPLLEYLIKTYTNEGDTVLDPTMGVGSTCVAAQNTSRAFIGFEKDPTFFGIADQRLG